MTRDRPGTATEIRRGFRRIFAGNRESISAVALKTVRYAQSALSTVTMRAQNHARPLHWKGTVSRVGPHFEPRRHPPKWNDADATRNGGHPSRCWSIGTRKCSQSLLTSPHHRNLRQQLRAMPRGTLRRIKGSSGVQPSTIINHKKRQGSLLSDHRNLFRAPQVRTRCLFPKFTIMHLVLSRTSEYNLINVIKKKNRTWCGESHLSPREWWGLADQTGESSIGEKSVPM